MRLWTADRPSEAPLPHDRVSVSEKAPDAFRTISEVGEDLDLPQHVLRFWETRFSQIRPLKRGGGRRYYRPEDVDLLRGIKHLLYGEGYTIKGVQRILKSQGLKFVQNVWRDPGSLAATPDLLRSDHDTVDEFEAHDEALDEAEPIAAAPRGPQPGFGEAGPAEPPIGYGALAPEAPAAASGEAPSGRLVLRPGDEEEGETRSARTLSREDVNRLRATLFELMEAKRLLDSVP